MSDLFASDNVAQVSVQDLLEESAEDQVDAKIEDLSSAFSECTSKSNLFGTYKQFL
jgi:hypothetical protein